MRWFKIFLLWLLMALLPLQGVAASAKAICMGSAHSGHHGSEAASFAQEFIAAHSDASAHGRVFFHKENTPTTSVQVKSSTCGSCANCCIGAGAPPLSLFSLPGLSHRDNAVAFIIQPLFSFIPPGLERPPKARLL